MRSRVTTRRIAALTATFFLAALALAACGSSSSKAGASASATPSSASSGSAASAAPAAVSTQIPAGTTLRVGDQLSYLGTILKLAGEDKNFPYTVKYSSFIGGPPMLQAFQAGALDAGFVGSTPLIFAQAGNQTISAVAGFATTAGSYQLLTAPGGHGVTSWASLKGKKVAYQQGTAGEAVLLQALNAVGLKLSDVTTVNVPQTSITAALQGGSADAGLSVEPLTSVYLAKNPTAKVAGTTNLITDRSDFIIASASALKNPGKEAALGDYISRLVKSFNYLHAHPQAVAEAIYVKQYGLTPARAAVVLKETGVATFIQLPGAIVAAQQKLADLYQSAGEIPSKVDVSSEFDTRYNAIVQKAQGS